MSKFTDAGAYMYHQQLVALRGAYADIPTKDSPPASRPPPARPTRPRRSSGPAPACRRASSEFQKDFITRYMDPTEVYDRIDDLAEQNPAIAQMVPLPHDTAGYQRNAMAMMAGTTAPGSNPSGANAASAVQLFSKAMGHLGGNLITAEFKDPGVAELPAERRRHRQRHHRQPGHGRRRRADQHRGAGRATRSTPTPPRARS